MENIAERMVRGLRDKMVPGRKDIAGILRLGEARDNAQTAKGG